MVEIIQCLGSKYILKAEQGFGCAVQKKEVKDNFKVLIQRMGKGRFHHQLEWGRRWEEYFEREQIMRILDN